MTRIAPVGKPTAEQDEVLAKTLRAPGGEALNVFATLAHAPQLLRRVNALGGYFMVHGDLSVRARELVVLRTAAAVESEYEIAHHRWLAERAGVEPDAIEAALDPDREFPWSPEDACVLRVAGDLLESNHVSADTWQQAQSLFTDKQCMELLVLAGFYRMLGGVLNALEVEVDPFLTSEDGA